MSTQFRNHKSHKILAIFVSCLLLTHAVSGLQVTGYSSNQNDRFLSGFPTSPTPNTQPAFFGLGRDFSGIAWSTQTHASSSYKGFAMLSPQHFLTAQHYEYGNDATTGVRVLGKDGFVSSVSGVSSISNLGHGLFLNGNYDLALGTLPQPLTHPSNIFRNAVLDLHDSSSSDTVLSYNALSLLLYGRGATSNSSPRVGAGQVDMIGAYISDPNQLVILTTRTTLQLETGDSGSPALHAWTNPNGTMELTLLGLNSAISVNYNFISFLPSASAINAANNVMTPSGHALRVVGNHTNTWVGAPLTSIGTHQAWGLSEPANAPTDKYVLFNALSASNHTVTVNSNHNLRGLYFKSTATDFDSFTFSGTSVLSIGRGGITNYDNDPQLFTAPLRLEDHQYWDAGPGGLSINSLNTNGKLLELRAGTASTISGVISGIGALALESGNLTLSANSTYTGGTWVHEGTLFVNGSILDSPFVRLRNMGLLSGSGSVSAVQGSGTISPGNGAAILSASSISPENGMDFAFEFDSTGSPQFGTPSASVNDLLRLTNPTPFSSALSSENRVAIYLNLEFLTIGQQFRGGFFTDTNADYLPSIRNATVEIYLTDSEGLVEFNGQTYSLYAGTNPVKMSTVPESANFPTGTVAGRILQLEVLDPSSYEGWTANAFPEATPDEDRMPDADPNGDGTVNLLAYALKLNPLQPAGTGLPQVTHEALEEGASELIFRFRRNKIATDLTYQVQVSDNLASWALHPQTPVVVQPDPDGDGTVELVEVTIPVAAEQPRKFVRLKIVPTE